MKISLGKGSRSFVLPGEPGTGLHTRSWEGMEKVPLEDALSRQSRNQMQLVTEVYCNFWAVHISVATSRLRVCKECGIIFLGFAYAFLPHSKPLILARLIGNILSKISVLFNRQNPTDPSASAQWQVIKTHLQRAQCNWQYKQPKNPQFSKPAHGCA